MERALLAKFNQNKDLERLLLSTGKRTLAENSPYDKYWGVGDDNSGQNKLGLLLMEVRSQLARLQSAQEEKEMLQLGWNVPKRPPSIIIPDNDPVCEEVGM